MAWNLPLASPTLLVTSSSVPLVLMLPPRYTNLSTWINCCPYTCIRNLLPPLPSSWVTVLAVFMHIPILALTSATSVTSSYVCSPFSFSAMAMSSANFRSDNNTPLITAPDPVPVQWQWLFPGKCWTKVGKVHVPVVLPQLLETIPWVHTVHSDCTKCVLWSLFESFTKHTCALTAFCISYRCRRHCFSGSVGRGVTVSDQLHDHLSCFINW